jgi:hypothetical protein
VPDVETLFYFGARRTRLDGHDLRLAVPDDFEHIGEKTLACFEYLLEQVEFDLVFRTNASSYVDLPNLRSYVAAQASLRGFYAGHLGATFDGLTFASGSGYFLSRDLLEMVVENRESWDHSLLDDVALARVLSERGIHPRESPRAVFTEPPAVAEVDTNQFHFRCKTPSRLRLDDVAIMVAVDHAFADARGLSRRRGAPLEWTLASAGRDVLRAVRAVRR